MANLFGLSSPQVIRESVRRQKFESAFQKSAAAGMGANIASGINRLFGLDAPEVNRAKKAEVIAQQVNKQFGGKPSTPQEFAKYGSALAGALMQGGLQEEALTVMERLGKLPQGKQQETFTTEYNEKGEPVGQRSSLTNKLVTHPQAKKDPLVNVSMGQKEGVKFSFQRLTKATDKAEAAKSTLKNLNAINVLMDGKDTGKLTDLRVAMAQVGASLGIPVSQDIADFETAQTAMGNLGMAVLNNFPGQISEGERKFALSIMPRLAMTSKGRKQLTRMMKILAKEEVRRARSMHKFMSAHGNTLLPEGKESFYGFEERTLANRNLFDDMFPKVTTQAQFDKLERGEVFMELVNGKWVRSEKP
jgi:hypothetical protein